MSGQLEKDEPSREEILEQFGKEFSSGKPERALKTSEAPDDAQRPDQPSPGAAPAADGAQSAKPDGKVAGKSDKPRDDTGKFAPAPEPFEGFSDLDPKVQKYFKNLQAEKSKLQNDYSAVAGRVQPLQRQLQELSARLDRPQTQAQGQKKVNDFLNSPKFKEFESRYPEDAEGIREGFQQTVDQLRTELADSGKPVADKLTQLEGRLSEYEQERRNEAARKETDRLTEAHSDWKRIAGWEDEDGNEVSEPSARKWHPWFTAWQNGLPASVRSGYDRLLAEASADSIGYVLTQFKRDVQAHIDASGQQRSDTPEVSDVAQRRSEALRDISPRPSRSGAETPVPQFNGSASDRNAVLSQLYDKWKAGQKL